MRNRSDYEKLEKDQTASSASYSEYRRQYQRFLIGIKKKMIDIIFVIFGSLILCYMIYLCILKYNQHIDEEDDMLSTKFQYNKIRSEEGVIKNKRDKRETDRLQKQERINQLHKSIEEYNLDIHQLKTITDPKQSNMNQLQAELYYMNELTKAINDKNDLIREREDLKTEIQDLVNAITKLKQKGKGINNDNKEVLKINSHILTSNTELSAIYNFFVNPERIKSLQLLYRRSDHGKMPQNFHLMCDGIKNTLVLIHAGDIILGGFTTQDWSGSQIYKEDSQAFLFNLNDNAKFSIQYSSNAIYCSENAFPTFGNGDLFVSKEQIASFSPYSYQKESGTINDLMNGHNFLPFKEMEVFRILF